MRRFILPLIIFALIALVAYRLLNERTNTLVTQSRRLLTTRYFFEHEWLDQDHILYREYHDPREFRVLNVSTGSDTAVPFMDPKLRAAQYLMARMIPLPDGHSFITFIRYGSGDAVWVPLKPDASHRARRLKRWPTGEFAGWLDGGKSFLMDTSRYPRGFEGALPNRYQRYRWPELDPIEPLTVVETLPQKDQATDRVWYRAGLFGGKVHLVSKSGKDTTLAWVDYSSGKARSERRRLPVDRLIFQPALSPDGRQLLWILFRDPGTSIDHVRFWLSTADGTEFREVAHTGESPKVSYNSWGIIPKVKWRPGGGAVSVQYRSGVFLLPLR